MHDSLISIIVPIYNTSLYLEKCLASIQNQTYKLIEVLLINDGSTDSSSEICKKFVDADSRFKLIEQPNGGRSVARNTGLAYATGEFIGFVDSDDWIDDDMFYLLYMKQRETRADIVQCGLYYHKPGRKSHFTIGKELHLSSKEALEMVFDDKRIKSYLCNNLYARHLFQGVTFPVNRNFEDIAVVFQLIAKCNIFVYIPQVKYHYIISHTSVTHSEFHLKDKLDYLLSTNEQYEYAKKHGLWKKSSRILARKYLDVINDCIDNNVKHVILDDIANQLYNNVNGTKLLFVSPLRALKRFLFLNHRWLYIKWRNG